MVSLGGVALAAAGCGQSSVSQHGNAGPTVPGYSLHAHPQAVEPVAGSAAASASGSGPAVVSVNSGSSSGALAQPVSDAEIRRELAASGVAGSASRATLTPDGLAIPPSNAPWQVQEMILAGNQIAHLPYRFGGGHGTFQDTAYDCSGSLSYVFAAAGLLNTTVVSGQLMTMGLPGPGKWVTIYANQGHTFAIIAGLRFDTVALAETGSRWSNRPPDEPDLASFAIRHPLPGL
jgi:hypothetical protein